MEILIKGGPMMFFILACSIVSITVFIGKIISFHKAQINVDDFMAGFRNELKSKRITEAASICDQTPGPVAKVLKAGVTNYDKDTVVIKEAMERVSIFEIRNMEKGVSVLATVGVISPLMGFLGTVIGLIRVFGDMSVQNGLITGSSLSVGIWQAMLTTAFGLAVAIPSYLAYNYLVSRVYSITRDMEESASELVSILAENYVAI